MNVNNDTCGLSEVQMVRDFRNNLSDGRMKVKEGEESRVRGWKEEMSGELKQKIGQQQKNRSRKGEIQGLR